MSEKKKPSDKITVYSEVIKKRTNKLKENLYLNWNIY